MSGLLTITIAARRSATTAIVFKARLCDKHGRWEWLFGERVFFELGTYG